MKVKGEEAILESPAAETLETAPEAEAEEVAEGYEIPAIYAPLTDVDASKNLDKFLSELKKMEGLAVIRHRPHKQWPGLIPEFGKNQSACYIYCGKESIRVETAEVKEVDGKMKTIRHTWSYQIKATGFYKSKEKTSMKVILKEIRTFAKARGWLN